MRVNGIRRSPEKGAPLGFKKSGVLMACRNY